MPQNFFSEEEAQQIISHPARSSASTGMTREELFRAAAEMGISPVALKEAEANLERQKVEAIQAEETRKLRAEYRRHRWQSAIGGLGGLVSAGVFFTALWWLFGQGYYWPIWVLIWPAIGFLSSLSRALFPGPKQERRYQHWLDKRERRGMPPRINIDIRRSSPHE